MSELIDTIFGSESMKRRVERLADEYVAPTGFIPKESGRREGISILGYRLLSLPNELARRPVLQISPDFEHCSPEFRAAWNAWALERFGTEEVCYLMDSSVVAEMQAGIVRDIERRVVRLLMGDPWLT